MSFSEIPNDFRVPGFYVEVSPTVLEASIGEFPLRVLLIGQRLSTGTVPALTLQMTTRASQAREEHGPGSLSHLMAEAFFAMNRSNRLDVISLADAAGTKASGSISFGGAVTTPGILYLYVAGKRLQVLCEVDLDTCATAVVAAINADPDLPVTAAIGVPTSKAVITAKHFGTVSNTIDLRVNNIPGEEVPPGLTTTIVSIGGVAAGAGDPDVADVLPVIAGIHYDVIIHPYSSVPANLDVLDVELESRFGPLSAMPGCAFSCRKGTLSALAAFGDTRNSRFSCIVGVESFPGWDVIRGAAIAGEATKRLDEHPCRSLTGRAKLPGYAPAESDRFTPEERNLLLHDGISTLRYDRGGKSEIENLITNNQETAGGSPDSTFLTVQKIFAISFARRSFLAYFAQIYQAEIIAEDGTEVAVGSPVVTPGDAMAAAIAWYSGLIRRAICQNLDGFKADSYFEVDETAPRVRLNGYLAVDFTNPLLIVAGLLRLRR